MESALHDALRDGRAFQHRLMTLAQDQSLDPQERGRRISALIAAQSGSQQSLAERWVAAGRPAPLGFAFNAGADHAEWFDAWFEVENVVLDGEDQGYSRAELEGMILRNDEPFDLEFEAEDLGVIHRSNEREHTE